MGSLQPPSHASDDVGEVVLRAADLALRRGDEVVVIDRRDHLLRDLVALPAHLVQLVPDHAPEGTSRLAYDPPPGLPERAGPIRGMGSLLAPSAPLQDV